MRIESDIKKTVAIMVALFAGFHVWNWLTHDQERGDLEARIESSKKQLGVSHQDTQVIDELREHVQELRQMASGAKKIVPPTNDLADVLRSISGQIAMQGMANQEVQTNAIVTGPQFSMIPLSLRFEGTYDSAFEVVRGIESSPRLMRINRFEVTGTPTKPRDPVVVRMDVMTFSTVTQGNHHE